MRRTTRPGASAARLPKEGYASPAEHRVEMSTWLWVAVAGAGLVVLSTAVSLAVASLLGRITRQEEADLIEAELWSITSLSREQSEDELEPEVRQRAPSTLSTRRSHH